MKLIVKSLVIVSMKPSQKLGLVAIFVFVISHFLPAFGSDPGFACFQVCWSIFLGHEGRFDGGWFYYSGFVISNILFPVLVVALFVSEKSRKLRVAASVVFLLHVLSWVVLHFFDKPPGISEIKIGYYLWLMAYGVLVAAHLVKEPIESLNSTATAHSVL